MTTAAESDFLLAMAAASHRRDERSRSIMSDAQLRSQLICLDKLSGLNLDASGFDLITEIKKRSPAEGELDAVFSSPAEQASAYAEGGAAALSVLTEPDQFKGSLDDMHEVTTGVDTPVMRKDFLVSRYQVREARLAGASGVLLIAAMLEKDQLQKMLEAAFELDMFVLLEAFDTQDLDKAVPVLERFGPAIAKGRCNYLLGVNCRDLRTLKVNFDHFALMAPRLPNDMPWVAESGLTSVEHAVAVAEQGYRLALVGTALMRSDNPAETVRQWQQAGQAVCS
ncbi:MAG: indole-3-glycerol phosphate synthase TrpC [Gammaproteobacteria bacterium]